MIAKLIRDEQREAKKFQTQRPSSIHNLTFVCETFDEGLKGLVQAQAIEENGSEFCKNFIVQYVDYVINPAIDMKNAHLLEGLVN